jgi:hypothetical protein
MGIASEIRRKGMILCILSGILALALPGRANETAGSPGEEAAITHSLKRARHMEFDERLIMGQSLKSGALYLFERKDSDIQTMLKVREDYRQELLAPFDPSP